MRKRSAISTSTNGSRLPSCALILFASLVGSSALATDTAPNEAPRPTPLEAGAPAPYTGTLLSTERAIRLGQRAERCEFLLADQVVKLTRLHEIDLQLEHNKLDIERDRARLREAEFERQLDVSWLEHPALVAAVTAVLTYAILRAAKELP